MLGLNRPQFGLDWFESPLVHASYVGLPENGVFVHELTIFGGLLRLPETSPETATLILCHELGHGIGGPPYKSGGMSGEASVEGQADYFATSECLPKVVAQWPWVGADGVGRRALEGFQLFLLRLNGVSTDLAGADPGVVEKLNTAPNFYPSPQCRIDTLLAGLHGSPRPPCWFPRSADGGPGLGVVKP